MIKQEAHGPWHSAWEPTWPFAKVSEIALYLRGHNWAYFHSMSSSFRDMCLFSKLPYLGMKLGHWPKCQKSHIYSLSTLGGQYWAYFRSTGSGFRDTGRFSKLPYLGMKLGNWPKFQKLQIYFLNYPPPLPESQISFHFTLRLAISKILAVLHFPIGHNVKFQSFLQKFKFEISKFL